MHINSTRERCQINKQRILFEQAKFPFVDYRMRYCVKHKIKIVLLFKFVKGYGQSTVHFSRCSLNTVSCTNGGISARIAYEIVRDRG